MSFIYKHKKSDTQDKRPTAAVLDLGEITVNYNSSTPGLFFEDSVGGVVKVGPAQVSTSAPNSSPAGSSGNTAGEFWFDTSGTTNYLKVYDGSAWSDVSGIALDASGNATFAGPTFSVNNDFDAGNTTLYADESEARVGINSSSPGYTLDIYPLGDTGVLSITADYASASAPSFDFYREQDGGGDINAGDGIFEIGGYASVSGSFTQTIKVLATAEDTAGNSSLDFQVQSGGTMASCLEIKSDGNVHVPSGSELILNPASSAPALTTDGEVTFEATDNTNLSVKHRGSDATTRTGRVEMNSAGGTFGICAHASFDGSTGGSFDWTTDTFASGNVSSITRTSQGNFTVNFDTDFTSANYTVVATAGQGNHTSSGRTVSILSRSASSVNILVERTDTGTNEDEAYIALMVIGSLT